MKMKMKIECFYDFFMQNQFLPNHFKYFQNNQMYKSWD